MTIRSCFTLICVMFAGIFSLKPAYGQDSLIRNGDFEQVGPNGSTVTITGPIGHTPCAADSWIAFAPVSGSTLMTGLTASDDPWGSGLAFHILTNAGEQPPTPFGNGVGQIFGKTSTATYIDYDIKVISGRLQGGLVSNSGPFVDQTYYGPTNGWIHISGFSTVAISSIGWENLAPDSGAEFYLDNVHVVSTSILTPVSESTSAISFGSMLIAVGSAFLFKRQTVSRS